MGRDGRGEGMVVRALGENGCTVTLRGEFDFLRVSVLGATLGATLACWSRVFVDLSGVTFLDGSCARELALLGGLHGDRLVFGNPSREVEVSVAACGLEDLVRFGRRGRRGEGDCSWRAAQRDGRTPRAAREAADDRGPLRR